MGLSLQDSLHRTRSLWDSHCRTHTIGLSIGPSLRRWQQHSVLHSLQCRGAQSCSVGLRLQQKGCGVTMGAVRGVHSLGHHQC